MRSSSKGRGWPARGQDDGDRGCPLRTGIDRPMWHERGRCCSCCVSTRRDAAAARRFFKRAIRKTKVTPIEVVTDRALADLTVLDDLLEATWHRTERYANNRLEADHGRLKARLGPMRGLSRTAAPASCSPGMRSSRTYDADTTSSRSTSRSPACGSGIQRVGIGDLMSLEEGKASACRPLTRCNRVANVPAVTPCRRENRAGSLADVDGAWCR
jgi:hypothetical protein